MGAAVKIESKITAYEVATSKEEQPQVEAHPAAPIQPAHQELPKRPDSLVGETYKIKSPVATEALYITINDIILNEGTPQAERRPYEIFFNSKNMEHFQWIVALTRVMSGVFRKGGDLTFLVDELKSVFDPRGGYFKKGGVYCPSLIAEIGEVLEQHLILIGHIQKEELSDHVKSILEEKRKKFTEVSKPDATSGEGYPASATLCAKCNVKAVIVDGGCAVCLACSDSKCQ